MADFSLKGAEVGGPAIGCTLQFHVKVTINTVRQAERHVNIDKHSLLTMQRLSFQFKWIYILKAICLSVKVGKDIHFTFGRVMFTGLIEEIGTVQTVDHTPEGSRLTIEA